MTHTFILFVLILPYFIDICVSFLNISVFSLKNSNKKQFFLLTVTFTRTSNVKTYGGTVLFILHISSLLSEIDRDRQQNKITDIWTIRCIRTVQLNTYTNLFVCIYIHTRCVVMLTYINLCLMYITSKLNFWHHLKVKRLFCQKKWFGNVEIDDRKRGDPLLYWI